MNKNTRLKNWPPYFKNQLILGVPKNNVAIITLWTQKEKIAEGLKKEEYSLVGNLYFIDGLNYIIRNVYANPKIRYLILCGKDLGKSGQQLLTFMKEGVDSERRIKETEVKIDPEITDEEIELFREKMIVINLIGEDSPEKISQEIKKLEDLEEFIEAKLIPDRKNEAPESFPCEPSGFLIKEKTIGKAWLKILHKVTRFGLVKETQYSTKEKEIMNMIVVVEEDPNNIKFEKYFNFNKEDLEKYHPQLTTPTQIEGINYTYGQKLMNFKGENQVENIIKQLNDANHSRRAVAVTWDPKNDSNKEGVPCLVLIQTIIQQQKLYLTAYMRSNDMFNAWPMNAFGLRKLQQKIAKETNSKLGSLTTISNSAHIYDYDWKKAQKILQENTQSGWELDPRGYVVISLEESKIIVKHHSNEHTKLKTYTGRSAKELYAKIVDDDTLSSNYHYSYLGSELEKAEIASRLGIKYVQDSDLELPGDT